MKSKPNYPTTPQPKKNHPSCNLSSKRRSVRPDPLDRVAEELIQLARNRLPNHVLRGVLTDLEEDIRQDAVLLSLSWYLRQDGASVAPKHPWHAARAIAAALRIVKRDYLKSIKHKLDALQLVSAEPEAIQDHPTQIRVCDWSSQAMRMMVRRAIQIALRNGRLSHANAAVALGILEDQIHVKEMARRLNISRGAVYQHLTRVRREIPDIIDGLEVPMTDLL